MCLCCWLCNLFMFWVLCYLLLVIWYKLVCKLCKESCVQICMKVVDIIDVMFEEVFWVMCGYGVCILIYGYIYWLVEYLLDIDGQFVWCIVFGDWDCQGWVLEIDVNGYCQVFFLF